MCVRRFGYKLLYNLLQCCHATIHNKSASIHGVVFNMLLLCAVSILVACCYPLVGQSKIKDEGWGDANQCAKANERGR